MGNSRNQENLEDLEVTAQNLPQLNWLLESWKFPPRLFIDVDGGSGEANSGFFFKKNKCYRRMLGISYKEHKTNEYV